MAAADVARVDGARRRARPARRGAEPDAADLPGARGRLHHAPDRRQPADRPVGVARLRLRGDGPLDRGGHARASRCSSATSTCPRATRRRSARRPPGATEPFRPGVATDGPWRWVFYTSGTTADPKGARHTDKTVGASAYAMDLVLEMTRRGPQRDGVPVHAHRRDRLAVRRADGRLRPRARRVVRAGHHHPGAPARAGHDRGRRHGVPPRVPHRAAGRAGPPIFPERARVRRWRRGEAAGAALRGEGRARRRRHRQRLRAHRGADPRDGRHPRRRPEARRHRGPRVDRAST